MVKYIIKVKREKGNSKNEEIFQYDTYQDATNKWEELLVEGITPSRKENMYVKVEDKFVKICNYLQDEKLFNFEFDLIEVDNGIIDENRCVEILKSIAGDEKLANLILNKDEKEICLSSDIKIGYDPALEICKREISEIIEKEYDEDVLEKLNTNRSEIIENSYLKLCQNTDLWNEISKTIKMEVYKVINK